jgi:glycerophosphoryl diester phosphodiesterase|nr:glycerophosphodiester phosphodiesterase family protein [Prevotella sp.]
MKNILVTLASIFFVLNVSAQNKGFDFLQKKMYDGGKSNYVMIFAHRGNWRGAPENSLQAYKQCINGGIDGIEIDIHMTKDSAIVMMHDDTVDRTTTGTGLVSDYTLAEIKQLNLKSPIGVITRQKVPTLDEVLDLCKGKVYIQIDKWQSCKEKVMEIVRKHNMQKQCIFRGTFNSQVYKEKYAKLLKGCIFSPVVVCNGKTDDQKLDDYMNHIKSPIMSLSFKKDDYPILNRADEMKKNGFRIWYNSLWDTFNGGHDDEMALDDPEGSYGWLLNKGANIIFCDNPFLLLDYLTKKGRR